LARKIFTIDKFSADSKTMTSESQSSSQRLTQNLKKYADLVRSIDKSPPPQGNGEQGNSQENLKGNATVARGKILSIKK
jgi:hypothetical protein